MTSKRSFRTAVNAAEIEFDIDGRIFRCQPQLPAGLIMRFADVTSGDDDENDTAASNSNMISFIRDFLDAAIVPEQRQEMHDLLNNPDVPISINLLLDVLTWLAAEYTARPTGESSSATSSPPSSGQDSTDGRSPTVTTYSRPEPVGAQT
jgi:hypothetical protein